MAHFYLSDDLEGVEPGASVSLSGAEARHAVTVSRLRAGERVTVGDGAGTVVEGVVKEASPSEVRIEASVVTVHRQPSPRVALAQALAKGDRDELAVQASTEIGVDGVVPWQAARSVSRWEGKKLQAGAERWRAVAREATKQSIRPWLPDVAPLHTAQQLAKLASTLQLLVLEPTATSRLSEVALDGRDVMLVVGPEGGIADTELALFADAGAQLVRLGETVLRTSTAGPAALAVLNARLGRW